MRLDRACPQPPGWRKIRQSPISIGGCSNLARTRVCPPGDPSRPQKYGARASRLPAAGSTLAINLSISGASLRAGGPAGGGAAGHDLDFLLKTWANVLFLL